MVLKRRTSGLQAHARAGPANVQPAEPPRQVWTFSSSGWLFVYHFGCIKALKELGLNRNVYVIGSSGGACAGSYLFLDASIEDTIDYVCACAARARSSLPNAFKISEYARGAVERFAPPNAGSQLTGNMEVSVTLLPWLRNKRVKEFADVQTVTDAIVASSCVLPIPPVQLKSLGGVWGMDGVYSDFQILKGVLLGRSFFTLHRLEDAIAVSPFYMSRADIKPSKYIPPWWAAYPPEPARLREVYRLGYVDALTWLNRNGRIPYGMSTGGEEGGEEGPGWWAILQDSVAGAPSCEAELGEVLLGVGALARSCGRCMLWALIILELGLMALVSGMVAALAPLLPQVSTSGAWARFNSVSRSATSPWLVLKTIPAISPWLAIRNQPKLQEQLLELSLLYRVFFYLL